MKECIQISESNANWDWPREIQDCHYKPGCIVGFQNVLYFNNEKTSCRKSNDSKILRDIWVENDFFFFKLLFLKFHKNCLFLLKNI